MKKRRSFKEFLDSSGEAGVKRVALEYAKNDDSVTIDFLIDKYNITKYGINQLFEYAIVHMLISYQAATLMKLKSHKNQLRHFSDEETTTTSDKKYSELIDCKRLDFIKNGLPDEKVKAVVDVYLNSTNFTSKQISLSLGLSIQELNLILKKAIVANIIDDNTLLKLNEVTLKKVKNSLKKNNVYSTLKHLEEKRKRFRTVSSELVNMYFQNEALEDLKLKEEQENIKEKIGTLEKEYFNFFNNL